jgi:hypothetical protein
VTGTPRQSSPPPLTHSGKCGRRVPCWRPECEAWVKAGYRTVEILPSGEVLAYCHRTTWHPRPVEIAA